MGQWLSYEFITTAETDTYKDVTLRIYYNTSNAVVDSTHNFVVTGAWPNRSGNVSGGINVGSGGSQLIYDGGYRINKQYGTTTSASFSASLTGIEYWGTSQVITTGGTATAAARPYVTPTAPSAATVARVSDTQQNVSWTNNPSTGGPYTNIKVQRRRGGSPNAWSTIATLAGTATSYSDTTTAKDGRYDYQVAASNSAGTSAYTRTSPDVSTTPNDPTSVVAVKNADGSITLTWADDDSGYPTAWKSRFDIERSVNGGAYANVANDLAEGLRTWTDTSPGVGTNQYRVQAWVPNTGQTPSTLSSGWGLSNTVATTAPPNAPTGLGPSTPVPGTEVVTVYWTHNPTDSSVQRKVQRQYRKAGTSTWTLGSIAWTAATSASFTPITDLGGLGLTVANGDTVEWQVRTWGASSIGGADATGASVWSATASFKLSARPAVNLLTPADAGTVTSSVLTPTWTFFDNEGLPQASWRAVLKKSGSVIETKTGSGTATSTTFATKLLNASSYSVTLDAKDSDGLWSAVDVASFTTNFLPPEDALISLAFDPATAAMAVTVSPQGYVGGVSVPATSFTLMRSVDGGGSWDTYLADVPINGAPVTVTDYAPLLGGVNLYRVIMTSATPSTAVTSDSDKSFDTTGLTRSVFLNAGPGFSLACSVRANVRENGNHNRAVRVTRRYAGREKPVAHVGTGIAESWSIAADRITHTADPGDSSAAEWRAMAVESGPFLLRTPEGLYEHVELGAAGIAIGREIGGGRHAISFTVEAIDG